MEGPMSRFVKGVESTCGRRDTLLATVKRWKINWLDHICRHNSLAKTILQGIAEGGRKRGRPRKSWLDNFKDWTGMNADILYRNDEDRDTWTRITAASCHGAPAITGHESLLIDWLKFCYYKIRGIRFIRNCIDDETCKTLIETPIIFRLYYGSALLYNNSFSVMNRLHGVQNCVEHLVNTLTKWKSNFILVALASYIFQICFTYLKMIQRHLNNLIPTYRLLRLMWSESCPLLMMRKATQQCTKRTFSEHQFPNYIILH